MNPVLHPHPLFCLPSISQPDSYHVPLLPLAHQPDLFFHHLGEKLLPPIVEHCLLPRMEDPPPSNHVFLVLPVREDRVVTRPSIQLKVAVNVPECKI